MVGSVALDCAKVEVVPPCGDLTVVHLEDPHHGDVDGPSRTQPDRVDALVEHELPDGPATWRCTVTPSELKRPRNAAKWSRIASRPTTGSNGMLWYTPSGAKHPASSSASIRVKAAKNASTTCSPLLMATLSMQLGSPRYSRVGTDPATAVGHHPAPPAGRGRDEHLNSALGRDSPATRQRATHTRARALRGRSTSRHVIAGARSRNGHAPSTEASAVPLLRKNASKSCAHCAYQPI